MALIRRSQAGRPQGVNASATNVRRYREESVPRENPAGAARRRLGSLNPRTLPRAAAQQPREVRWRTSRGHRTMGGAGKRWRAGKRWGGAGNVRRRAGTAGRNRGPRRAGQGYGDHRRQTTTDRRPGISGFPVRVHDGVPYSGPEPSRQRRSRWSERRLHCSVNPSA